MKLEEAIDVIFSHNEVVAIWDKYDDFHDICVWHGMAWDLPDKYKNVDRWQIFGAIVDKYTDSDRINIKINDAVSRGIKPLKG